MIKTNSKLVQRLLEQNLLTEELFNRASNAQEKAGTKLLMGEALVVEFRRAVKEALEADSLDIKELAMRMGGCEY